MAKIEQYIDKKGNKLYKFQVYTGINPKTGKRSQTTRRGFKTKTAANQALKQIESKVADGSYWKEENKKSDYTLGELIDEYLTVRSMNLK